MLLCPLLRWASTQQGREKETPPLQPAVGYVSGVYKPLYRPAITRAARCARVREDVRLLTSERVSLGTAGSSSLRTVRSLWLKSKPRLLDADSPQRRAFTAVGGAAALSTADSARLHQHRGQLQPPSTARREPRHSLQLCWLSGEESPSEVDG
ncbi:hypothetical protein MHYP_G00171630 [Metynnis hypsauchen]